MLSRWSGSVSESSGRWSPAQIVRAVWTRAPVSVTLLGVFFGALLALAAAPMLVQKLMLIPAELIRPWGLYRLLTYALVVVSLSGWGFTGAVVLLSGWLAERWLDRRTMWFIAALAAVSGGVIYAVLTPVGPPLVGGGVIAAGFAGGAVATSAARRHEVSRGTRIIALTFLAMYGLTVLGPNPQDLAMFGAFVIVGGFTTLRLRSRGDTRADQHTAHSRNY